MTKMHSQRRSLSAALDMVEAAISSLENQAKQAKEFEEQQQQQLLQTRLTPLLPVTPDMPAVKEPIINYQLLSRPVTELQSQLPVTNNSDEAKLNHLETFNKMDTNKKINHKVVGSTGHKKHKSGKKIRTVLPGVLLRQRSSTPRKKSSHKRSSGTGRSNGRQHGVRNRLTSSPVITERNNNSIIQSDDKEDPNDSGRDLKSSSGKHRSGYLKPTLSSKQREQLTDKPKKKEKSLLPFVPGGSQGKSYHVGVIIQKELGKLKSQPLEVWAAAKHNAAKREAAAAP